MGLFRLAAATAMLCAAASVYADYNSVLDQMRQLQNQQPDLVHLFSIGKNDQGTDLMAMRISTNPAQSDASKVGHLMVATHHGNETHAAVFAMQYSKFLLDKYTGSELFRTNLADIEWTIIPVLNVPGFNRSQRNENGQDSNRDYPCPCTSKPGGKLASIRHLMTLMNSRVFSGSVTVHGYVGSLTYPWGIDVEDTHTADHNEFEKITSEAAKLNGYQYGTSTDIVYPADGTFEDYAYWKHGLWSLLLELRNGSDTDIKRTMDSIWHYYDSLDSSPSTDHALKSACLRTRRPDLHLE